jgi:hypothetical protein
LTWGIARVAIASGLPLSTAGLGMVLRLSMVEVSRLISPDMLVEIETDDVVEK